MADRDVVSVKDDVSALVSGWIHGDNDAGDTKNIQEEVSLQQRPARLGLGAKYVAHSQVVRPGELSQEKLKRKLLTKRPREEPQKKGDKKQDSDDDDMDNTDSKAASIKTTASKPSASAGGLPEPAKKKRKRKKKDTTAAESLVDITANGNETLRPHATDASQQESGMAENAGANEASSKDRSKDRKNGDTFKKKRKKTRSRQKNIRKDNRPDNQKPTYLNVRKRPETTTASTATKSKSNASKHVKQSTTVSNPR
eukprot:GILK01008711.1.p1 GENE.GILK01008711.1~~GILK01008711.1.p1  ORF type:complete len:270 (-),score=50.74 GILK01008711.1:180-944(-)